jgi:hypothetical protein
MEVGIMEGKNDTKRNDGKGGEGAQGPGVAHGPRAQRAVVTAVRVVCSFPSSRRHTFFSSLSSPSSSPLSLPLLPPRSPLFFSPLILTYALLQDAEPATPTPSDADAVCVDDEQDAGEASHHKEQMRRMLELYFVFFFWGGRELFWRVVLAFGRDLGASVICLYRRPLAAVE